MDFLLFVQDYNKAVGYKGLRGDFEMNEQGKLSRPDIDGNYSLMYTGLNILKPAIISENPLRIFSLKEYYLNSDKIFGIKAKDAKWYHASRPEDLIDIESDMLDYQKI
jgi:NDP-sugar pyrophosphorylase family protein